MATALVPCRCSRPASRKPWVQNKTPNTSESKGSAQAAQLHILAGTHPSLSPGGEAGDADRAAQKEKLHAELKRVLQKKSETSQRSVEEAEEGPLASGEMEAQLRAMEKTIETSELLEIIVETEAQTGVSGMSVAGGGRGGLFVKDVLKDSPAAKALSLKQGDQLLSARVYFDDIKYEDALRILKCVEPYKVSFWLKRTVPGVDITRKPGTSTFEVKGPKAKMAKLNIRSLTPLQRKKKKKVAEDLREMQARGSSELEPLEVEFSLPKFSRLRKAKSAGEVAVAEPSPDLSARPSSLETKRRKLKFPRLKVKDVVAAAAAARAEGRLEVGLPKPAVGTRAAGKGETEGKGPSRFVIPFPKSKKPREGAGPKAEVGFQAPQVEVDLPLPRVRPGGESPKATVKGEGLRIQAPPFGLPEVEAVLPTVSAVGLEGPESSPQAGLRLPTAEVVAPKVDVDLSLPKWEGAAPDVPLKGEGFRIKVPTFGISADEAEMKLPTVKAPALEVALGKGRGKADGLEETSRLGVTVSGLEVEPPSVDLELPLPKRKADVELPKPRLEIPDVLVKVPAVSLPKLDATKCHEELEGKWPQVELDMGKPESPRAKGPKIQLPGLAISLLEGKLESKAGAALAAGGKAAPPGARALALDVSVPRAGDLQLPKASVELAAPAPGAKAEVAAEGAGFKLHMPQVSLPKFDITAKTAPSPSQAPTSEPKPEVNVCLTVDAPKLDLSLPAVKLPAVQLPKAHLPRPELDVAVERPEVEVAVPSPRLSFPSAALPTLEMDLPKVGVELGLLKAEGKLVDSDHEVKMTVPTLETLGKELEVEISVPTCRVDQSELEPSGRALEGPEVSGVVAKIPRVGLALGKEPPDAEGVEGKTSPKAGLGMDSSATGTKAKLPSVEISAVKGPDVTTKTSRSREAEAKLKSPKFALPKFSISGPKIRRASRETEAPGSADRGSKLKMPKFGISFPKSRLGVEIEGPGAEPGLGGKTTKGSAAVDTDVSERGLKFPSVELPTVGPGRPEGKAELSEEEGSLRIDLPVITLKVPQVLLPKLGGRGREVDQELQAGEAKLGGGREGLAGEPEKGATVSTVSKFKMLSFSRTCRDGGEAEAGPAESRESPGLRGVVPLLDIAVPGAKAEGELALEKPVVDVSEADIRGYEGELMIPRVPSLGVSAPNVELDISLPTIGPEVSMPQGAIGAEAKIRLPKVELPKFGKSEEGGLEAEVQLLGGRGLSLGREGKTEAEGLAEGSLLGPKIRVPKVDISLPKARLSDVELPLTEGEAAAAEGPEGKFKMPSVGLPKFSTPKVKAPELEFGMSLEATGKGRVSGPAFRLSKLGGSSSDGEGDLPRVPQLELKAPKLRGLSTEMMGTETAVREAKVRVPSGPVGFGLSKAEAEETTTGTEDSKFKLKIPSLSISKVGTEAGTDTQPLCPSAAGAEFSFKVPQIALPDVGFSVEQEGKREATGEAGTAGLEVGMGGVEAMLKVPKIKVPAFGGSGPQGDTGTTAPSQGLRGSGGGDLGGPKAAFKVPGVELSAPTLKARAEYEVEGARLRHSSSHELGGPDTRGCTGSDGQKSPGGKAGASDADAGRKYRVKLPKFGLSLPKAGLEASESALGQEADAKVKRPIFVLARPKGKEADGSSGLLEGDKEGDSKGVMAKLKLRPTFGLSLSKPKIGGAEVNGELEEGASSKLKIPKLGFSNTEEAAQHHGERAEASSLQNGAQDGKPKLGKIRLPQVELSSPSKMSETDPELNLNLVRAEEAKEEDHSSTGPFSSLKAPKIRTPKIIFSGLKKRNGEAASSAVGSSVVRTEAASLETGNAAANGEKSSRFRFPKLVLSPKPHGVLEITSERPGGLEGDEEGLKIKLPSVGFSEELGSEDQILAVGGGLERAGVIGEREATAAV